MPTNKSVAYISISISSDDVKAIGLGEGLKLVGHSGMDDDGNISVHHNQHIAIYIPSRIVKESYYAERTIPSRFEIFKILDAVDHGDWIKYRVERVLYFKGRRW